MRKKYIASAALAFTICMWAAQALAITSMSMTA